MARTKPRLSATARGYGPDHRKRVEAAKAAWRPGQPCARCGRPITSLTMVDRRGRTVSAVDLGHVGVISKTAYGGLEHRFCNRSHGATMGNRMRGLQRQWATSRRW